MSTAAKARRDSVLEAAAVIGTIFIFNMQEAMIAAAFPRILKELSFTPVQAGWFFSGTSLAAIVALPLIGRLGDLFSKGWIVAALILLATGGAVVSALGSNFGVVFLGQVMLGLSVALHPMTVALMTELLPPDRAPMGNGFMVGGAVGGTTVGLICGGFVVNAFGFRGIYWVPLPALAMLIGVIVWLQFGRYSTPRVKRSRQIDWVGWALLGVGSVLLMLFLGQGAKQGWTSLATLGQMVGAAVVLGVWIQAEKRHSSPLVDIGLFTSRGVALVCVIALAMGAAVAGVAMLVPMILQADPASGIGLGVDVMQTGLYLLPFGIAASISAPLNVLLRKLIGGHGALLFSTTMVLAAACWVYLFHTEGWHFLVGTGMTGVGIGLASAELANSMVAFAGKERAASATSMMYVIKSVGSMICAQLCGGLLGVAAHHGIGPIAPSGFEYSLLLTAGIATLGVVAALSLSLKLIRPQIQ
ncbi:MAG: MFS transporter [Burkholderiales bacterium]|jgi:MFS family permease|nr:MFS transporter [Burkholderiales bacterium]